jgi:hypothetical protein
LSIRVGFDRNLVELHVEYTQDASGIDELQATQVIDVNEARLAPTMVKAEHVTQTLAAGIQDITNAMVEDFKLADVLRMILEAMYRALDFHRVIFCMRDPKTDTLTGRFGLGPGCRGCGQVFLCAHGRQRRAGSVRHQSATRGLTH